MVSLNLIRVRDGVGDMFPLTAISILVRDKSALADKGGYLNNTISVVSLLMGIRNLLENITNKWPDFSELT